jgi:hypothetical protein
MNTNFDAICRACLPAMEAAPERAAKILAAALGTRSTADAAAYAPPPAPAPPPRRAPAPPPRRAPPIKYTPEEEREIRQLYAEAVASKMTTAEFENYLARKAAGLPARLPGLNR